MKPEYFTQSQLLSSGWTNTTIIRYLGEPDSTKPNPKYRCAAPMKLYAAIRVNAVLTENPGIIPDDTTRQARSQSAQKAVATKTAKLLAPIPVVQQVCQLPQKKSLISQIKRNKGIFERVDYETMSRWIDNSVRHEYTN